MKVKKTILKIIVSSLICISCFLINHLKSIDRDASNQLIYGQKYTFNEKQLKIKISSENIDIKNLIKVKLYKSIDGDTAKFIIDNEIITCRFLAIDTMETVHPNKPVDKEGILASDYTKNKLNNAKEIFLELDENSDKYDKYNRILAWVWVDGNLLQQELLQNGLAEIRYIYGEYKYLDRLKE